MDWLWSKWSTKQDDPVSKLDPGLKEFLKEQQPAKYETTPPPAAEAEPKKPKEPVYPDTNAVREDRPLPAESLFPDGRYAHLWTTYTSQREIEQAQPDPTRVVMEQYKDRRQLVHRAALENCAEENEKSFTCFGTGDYKQMAYARATMCRAEEKAWHRCYQLQARFLLALGYMSPHANTTPEEDERIQMHADKLYHRMTDYEIACKDARENDDPEPPLTSIFDLHKPAPDNATLKVPPVLERKIGKPLHELTPHEQELAVAAWKGRLKANSVYSQDLNDYRDRQIYNKKKRQEVAVRIFGDTVGRFVVQDVPAEAEAAQKESGSKK